MVTVYNSRTVKTMSAHERDTIINHGVPIDIYEKGVINLGPSNRSAIKRFANIISSITEFNLPLPPSPFIEMIVDRTTGPSKQDFRQTMDGDPGDGKSYSSCYLAARYAIEIADRLGQDPRDYFKLGNCALLEDSEKIMQILDESDSQQAIVIDDSGIFADARKFSSKSNINTSKIWQTCRTRRWYTIFNVPRVTHIDLRIRELVNAKSSIYKPLHAAGCNIIKVYSSKITSRGTVKKEINPKFVLDEKKIDFFVAYSTDLLDPYVGLVKQYDLARDEAATRLIHEIAGEEALINNPGPTKREAKEQEITTQYSEKVRTMLTEGISERGVIKACPGLTQTYLTKIRQKGGF
jgi:hypothetical protein